MSSQTVHSESFSIHLLAHILDTCAAVTSVAAPFFTVYPTASHPSTPERGRAVGKNTATMAGPFFPVFWTLSCNFHPSSLLPMATLIPSIQPNLDLPHTLSSLAYAINTLPAIRYSSILSNSRQTKSKLSDPIYSPTPFLF